MKIVSNDADTVSVSTKVPDMKATPRAMANAVKIVLSLWPRMFLRATLNMGSAPEGLELVQHRLGRG